MHELRPTNATLATRYSPVTFNHDWPKLERLVFMLFCSSLGSTMNGFFVAAFFVEHTLKRVGNVFLACIGMSDLIMTTGVMPTAAVVLLSGEWDTVPVCQALQFLAEAATYTYSIFFALVAAETYYRLCCTAAQYDRFISMRIGLVSIFVFVLGFLVAGIGVYHELDYDYCQRKHHGHFYFRVSTSSLFHGIPFLLTLFGLIASAHKIRQRARKQAQYKRSQQYERDYSTTTLNITAYLLYVSAWIPYFVVIHIYPNTSDTKFYHCAWIGICRSIITSFLYSSANRNFRRAFAHLFNYCCCKSTLSGSFASRHRRTFDYKPTTGDVRVHIMHQAMSPNFPQRASSSRETQEL